MNSLTLGGWGGVDGGGVTVLGGVVGPGGGVTVLGGGVVGPGGGVTVLGGVGGGAAVPLVIVAGRFGHPTRKRARINRGATRSKLPRRCDMFFEPPFNDRVIDALTASLIIANPITEDEGTKNHLWPRPAPSRAVVAPTRRRAW